MLPLHQRVKASAARLRSHSKVRFVLCLKAAGWLCLPYIYLLAPFVIGKVTKIRRSEAGGGEAERMAAEGGTLLKS